MYMNIRHEWNFNSLQWNKLSLLTYLGPIAGRFVVFICLLNIENLPDNSNIEQLICILNLMLGIVKSCMD